MKTKWLMAASAIVTALLGLALTFAPAEVLRYFGGGGAAAPLLLQIAGAAFLGFAILDWMAKESTIGGIYNKPLALGNFLHFVVGAIAIVKFVIAGHRDPIVIAAGAIYVLMAIGFGRIVF